MILIASFISAAHMSPIHAQVRADEKTLPDYVPNQIIVKYKEDLAPHLLLFKAEERKTKQKTFFGKIGLFFENLNLKLKGQESPEEHLATIQQVDEKIGAVAKDHLFKGTAEEKRNAYLIHLDGSMTVEQAIKMYKTLPEVEYAETNNIAYPTNIY